MHFDIACIQRALTWYRYAQCWREYRCTLTYERARVSIDRVPPRSCEALDIDLNVVRPLCAEGVPDEAPRARFARDSPSSPGGI